MVLTQRVLVTVSDVDTLRFHTTMVLTQHMVLL